MGIPKKLETYLKSHLRVMVTFGLPANGNVAEWGIYFSRRSKPTGDDEFRGEVNDSLSNKLKWKPKQSLWLVPLNEEANKISEAKNGSEKIRTSSLSIRNAKGGANWEKYVFEDAEPGLSLKIEENTLLTLNNKIGSWHTLKYTGEAEWNLWLTTEEFNYDEKIISFNAPISHIINDEGIYPEFEISFGVRSQNSDLPLKGAYLHINSKQSQKNEDDHPFIWAKNGRYDDVTTLREFHYSFKTEDFRGKSLSPNVGNEGSGTQKILRCVNEENPINLASWILKENQTLSIIYAKSYQAKNIKFITNNFIKVLQINRPDKAYLYSKFYDPQNILDEGRNILSKVRDGINYTQSSNPIGIVPDIEEFTGMHSWAAEWSSSYRSEFCSQKEYTLNNSKLFTKSGYSDTLNSLSITLPLLKTTKKKNSPISLKNADLEAYIGIEDKYQELQEVNDNGTALRFILASYELESNLTLIEGAFEFEIGKSGSNSDLPPKKYGEIKFTLQNKSTQQPFFFWQYHQKISKEAEDIVLKYSIEDFSLPIKEVRAAGQDLLNDEKFLAPGTIGAIVEGQGERNDLPLIIPIPNENNRSKADDKNSYFLKFSESINVGQDYRLDVKLEEFMPEANDERSSALKAVIIDTNPQFVGLLEAKFLQQPGYDDGAWILARRSPLSLEKGTWEILDDSANTEGFKLILPAQAIGEAYVKTDEIAGNDNDGEPKKNKPIEYKFGAPAILRLSNERLERRYVAPPWNLRHIWGQPGSEAPGVPFLEAQFELLYGLVGHLKPENTFIAELASKLGEIPVPPDNSIFWQPTKIQNEAFRESWKSYLRFFRSWKSRLAILELSQENAFGNAKFVENLKYKPRVDFRSTLLRTLKIYELENIIRELNLLPQNNEIEQLLRDANDLIAENEVSIEKDLKLKESLSANETTKEIYQKCVNLIERFGASLRYPIKHNPDDIPEHGEITQDDFLQNLKKKIKAAHDRNGLAGGFHYGFESEAIYEECWREAFKDGSSSAELEGAAFSSIGGWGKQTARFAGDKTVIKSTTAMGRTNFYAVERIGRIGVLWHRAKHVIEYERTVVPSPYFKEQPELLGRPLVRKVREYIEILEPSKYYPDFENQADEAPGSIKACHFKSLVIPVRSSWGKDVSFKDKTSSKLENYGWEICLWHPDVDPKLFPKPQVVFELIPPANSNVESVIVNLSEPQNLWFYTDTREKVVLEDGSELTLTADTSKWQAIKYVDYTDLPVPNEKHLAPALDANSGKGMEQIMPDILDVPPGFERFTFRVDKSELPSGVANRYNDKSGISGKMMAVTMMRKRYEKDEKPQQHEKEEYKVFQALVENSESPINKIYNGEFSNIQNIDLLKNKVTSFFSKEVDNRKLFELFTTLDSDKTDTLKYFKDLYLNTTNQIPVGQPLPPDYPFRLEMFPTKFLWKEAVVSAEGLLNRTVATYEEQARICKNEIDEIIKQGGHQKDEAVAVLQKFKARIGAFHLNIDYGIEFISNVQNQAETGFNQLKIRINTEKEEFIKQIESASNGIQKIIEDTENDLADLKIKSLEMLDIVITKCNDYEVELGNIKLPNSATALQELKVKLIEILTNINTECGIIKNNINSVTDLDSLRDKLETAKIFIKAEIEDYTVKVEDFLEKILDEIRNTTNQFKDFQNQVKKDLEDSEKLIIGKIDDLINEVETKWNNGVQIVQDEIIKLTDSIKNEFILNDEESPTTGNITSVKFFVKTLLYNKEVDKISVFGILRTIDQWLSRLFENSEISNLIEQAKKFGDSDEVEKWLKTFSTYNELEEAIKNGNKDEIIKKSAAMANAINQEFGKLAGEVAEKIKQLDQAEASFEAMRNSGQQVLDNYRSVWEEFTAPGMGLNRKTVAMIVNFNVEDVQQRLSITPCIAKVKQFEHNLEALGLRLPVTNVFDGLLPPKPEWAKNVEDYAKSLLSKFDFSDIISDIAGMKLWKMLAGFKMPDNLRDNIKLTQKIDDQTQTLLINAEIDFNLDEPQSLLNIGPIELKLNQGKFVAKLRTEINIEGKTKKENSGRLEGNWETHIGGTPIMVFKEAKVIYENENLTFDLDPNRMEMPGLLKLLTDASKQLQTAPTSGSGKPKGSGKEKEDVFKIGMLEVEGGDINQALTGRKVPIGVKSTLDIPPISVGGGTTSMTNLSFGGHFVLKFWDEIDKRFGFMTGLGFYLGKKEAPFNFTAFILGGGGFVNCELQFRPEQGLTVKFVMSVHASAGFAVTAGWINGSVLICLGLEGEYTKTPNTESTVSMAIFVQLIGNVNILGLANVFLFLRLEANYNGRKLLGKGTVVLEIEICWCVTVKVNKEYQKTFSGDDSNSNQKKLGSDDKDKKAVKISNSLG